MIALKKIGFSHDEIKRMDMSEAFDFIDAANPPDEDDIWREATPEEQDAFFA